MSTFNLDVHTAMYHNSNPFVLVEYTKRFKRCRGACRSLTTPSSSSVTKSGRTSTVVGTDCQLVNVEWQNDEYTFTAITACGYASRYTVISVYTRMSSIHTYSNIALYVSFSKYVSTLFLYVHTVDYQTTSVQIVHSLPNDVEIS